MTVSDNIILTKKSSVVFSRSVLLKMIENDDFSEFNKIVEDYRIHLRNTGKSYYDIIKKIYSKQINYYQNEYIFKNTIINRLLLKAISKDSAVFSEFRVGDSIADLVSFDNQSTVFEIKTQYDSPARLITQLSDYKKIFNQCYLVVHESQVNKYKNIDTECGIISISSTPYSTKTNIIRESSYVFKPNALMIMKVLRTKEYLSIINRHYGEIPGLNSFNMYKICSSLIQKIPSETLNSYFVDIMKSRYSIFSHISRVKKELRQIALALNLPFKEYIYLENLLKQKIRI